MCQPRPQVLYTLYSFFRVSVWVSEDLRGRPSVLESEGTRRQSLVRVRPVRLHYVSETEDLRCRNDPEYHGVRGVPETFVSGSTSFTQVRTSSMSRPHEVYLSLWSRETRLTVLLEPEPRLPVSVLELDFT